jgi:hypothetical protein
MMDEREIRLRLIEAAAKVPHNTHPAGVAAGVLETARAWEAFILRPEEKPGKSTKTLGLPGSLK